MFSKLEVQPENKMEAAEEEHHTEASFTAIYWLFTGDRGGTVVKVLCHKSEGRWFDPRWCQWIFH